MKNLLILLITLTFLLTIFHAVYAQETTIVQYVAPSGNDAGYCTLVEQPCQTISYALAKGLSNIEVRVAAGVYPEAIFVGQPITLTGGFTLSNWITPSWTTNLTILDGQNTFRPLTLQADRVRVDGFVVRNGNATFADHLGGGVLIGGRNNTIAAHLRNLRVENNIASTVDGGEGGGVAVLMGDTLVSATQLTLENVSVISNTASNGHLGASGGGISLQALAGSHLDVAMNQVRIERNRAGYDFTSSGGGLALNLNGGTATLQNTYILSNSAAFSPTLLGGPSRGGGIYLINGNLNLENVLLAGNAGERGDALSIQAQEPVSVTVAMNYVTLADNYRRALDASAAIHSEGNGVNLRLSNTLISGNPTAIKAPFNAQPVSLTLSSTLVDNNVTSLTVGKVTSLGAPLRGAANYVDAAAGDYRLSAASAAIGKGNNLPPLIDLAGAARPSGAASEIGAFEFTADQAVDQTISFAVIPDKLLSEPGFVPSARASSGLPVRFVSNTPAICTVTNGTVTVVALGVCSISALQEGNEAFKAAPPVLRSFAVRSAQKSDQTLTFAPLAAKVLGDPPFTPSASASSGLPVGFVSDTPGVCTVNGNIVTLVASGDCSIRALQEGNELFNPATPVTQSFRVSEASHDALQRVYLPVVAR